MCIFEVEQELAPEYFLNRGFKPQEWNRTGEYFYIGHEVVGNKTFLITYFPDTECERSELAGKCMAIRNYTYLVSDVLADTDDYNIFLESLKQYN